MKNIKISVLLLTMALGMTIILNGCSPKTTIIKVPVASAQSNDIGPTSRMPEQLLTGSNTNMIPKATVFQMSGDYADNVAVTLGPDGNLVYYPAPSDISVYSKPLALGDGWYLNRQGLGPNSVFTKWTFYEYRTMEKLPTPDEIKAAIIPGACVTEFRELSIPASKASAMSPEQLLKLIME